MPLFDFKCEDCGQVTEALVFGDSEKPACRLCGSVRMTRQVSAPSALSGSIKNTLPGLKDTACCGSVPGKAEGCAGPGSCCGKTF